MRFFFFCSTITFLLFFFQNSLSVGQEEIELEKIVVTPSRFEIRIKDAPGKVTVIDSKEIERLLPKNADDLLRGLCGVDISRRTGFTSAVSTVTLRGFGGVARGRTLVLLDGIPFNEIYGGEVYWNAIPLEDIERIEIYPGAVSALYGPGAMGGVINIITKRPLKREFKLSSEYGDLATKNFKLSLQDVLGRFRYRLSSEYFKTKGYVAVLPERRRPHDIRRSKENNSLNLKLFYELDEDSQLDLRYRNYHEDVIAGRRYFYGSKDLNNISFGFKRDGEMMNFCGNLYFNWDDTSWTYDRAPSFTYIFYVNRHPRRYWGLNLKTDFKISEVNRLILGTDYRWGRINSRDEYRHTAAGRTAGEEVITKGKQKNLGFYLRNEMRFLGERLILNWGGRFDRIKSFDGYLFDDNLTPIETYYPSKSDRDFSPKIALIYHLDETTTIRTSFGKAFRPPTLYDLYRTWRFWGVTFKSNPHLGPEYTYSYEVGIDKKFGEKFLSRLTFYYNDAKDFIYGVDIGGGIREKQNIAEVQIYGLELEARYNIFKDLSFFTNYTFNRSEIEKFERDVALEGKSLTYTPKNKASFGLSFDNPKLFKLDLRTRYTGSVFHNDRNTLKLEGFSVWDFVISRKIIENLEISLKIENIFDESYQEFRHQLAPPRIISGNVRLKF